MAARDDLQVFANNTVVDPIEGTPNKLSIGQDLWDNGWLFQNPVAGQHLNEVLYLLTSVVKDDTLAKTLNLSDVVDKAAARSNLDLLQKSQNFADVPDKAEARTNLGLDIDTLYNSFFDRMYPVGIIYENKTNAANPATYFGRGTWVAEGAGRVAIGAGSGTDINGTAQNFAAGSTGGEYSHELTEAEMPSHDHPYRDRYYVENSGNLGAATSKETMPTGYNASLGANATDTDNTTWLYYDTDTSSTGGGQKHNNVQPYTVYYRWLRTA